MREERAMDTMMQSETRDGAAQQVDEKGFEMGTRNQAVDQHRDRDGVEMNVETRDCGVIAANDLSSGGSIDDATIVVANGLLCRDAQEAVTTRENKERSAADSVVVAANIWSSRNVLGKRRRDEAEQDFAMRVVRVGSGEVGERDVFITGMTAGPSRAEESSLGMMTSGARFGGDMVSMTELNADLGGATGSSLDMMNPDTRLEDDSVTVRHPGHPLNHSQSPPPPVGKPSQPTRTLQPVSKAGEQSQQYPQRLPVSQPALDAAVIILIDYTPTKFRNWIVEEFNTVKKQGTHIDKLIFEFLIAATWKQTPASVDDAVQSLKKVDGWIRRNAGSGVPDLQRREQLREARQSKIIKQEEGVEDLTGIPGANLDRNFATLGLKASDVHNLAFWLQAATPSAISALLGGLQTWKRSVASKEELNRTLAESLDPTNEYGRVHSESCRAAKAIFQETTTALDKAIKEVQDWIRDHNIPQSLEETEAEHTPSHPFLSLPCAATNTEVNTSPSTLADTVTGETDPPNAQSDKTADDKMDLTAKVLRLQSLRILQQNNQRSLTDLKTAQSNIDEEMKMTDHKELRKKWKIEQTAALVDALTATITDLEQFPGLLDAEEEHIPLDVITRMHVKSAVEEKRQFLLHKISRGQMDDLDSKRLEGLEGTIAFCQRVIQGRLDEQPLWLERYRIAAAAAEKHIMELERRLQAQVSSEANNSLSVPDQGPHSPGQEVDDRAMQVGSAKVFENSTNLQEMHENRLRQMQIGGSSSNPIIISP